MIAVLHRLLMRMTVAADDVCSTESDTATDCCAPKAGRRMRIMTLSKAMLWGVTVPADCFDPTSLGGFLPNLAS